MDKDILRFNIERLKPSLNRKKSSDLGIGKTRENSC